MNLGCRVSFILAVVVAVAIFFMSSFNSEKSSKQSDSLARPIIGYLENKCSVETTTNQIYDINFRESEKLDIKESGSNIFKFEKNSSGKNVLSKKQWKSIISDINKFVRKCAHIFLYFFFTFFLLIGFRNIESKIKNYYKLLSLLCNMIYAITDEVHQLFTGRTSTFMDVLIDFSGGLAAVAVYILVRKLLSKVGQNLKM